MPRGKKQEPFDAEKRGEFLTHLRAGMRRGAAAEALGLTRKEVIDYIAAHEGYEALVLDAEGHATEHVEEALYQAAVSGNVAACKLWLDLRRSGGPKLPPMTPDPTGEHQLEDELAELVRLSKPGR